MIETILTILALFYIVMVGYCIYILNCGREDEREEEKEARW